MPNEEIIMYDSPEAAKEVTVTGWVDRYGRFYGNDEHAARWSGCTHMKCECGSIREKGWLICEDCRYKKDIERFNALPFEEWDLEKPVCTWDGDKYFFDIEDLEEYMEDNELDDIGLLVCVPIHYSAIDSEDVTNGDAHEDWEPSAELEKKMAEFNSFIATLPPHSWMPGKIRTNYKRQTS